LPAVEGSNQLRWVKQAYLGHNEITKCRNTLDSFNNSYWE